MAKQKKRADGRIEGSFMFNGRQIHVYGKTKAEVSLKIHKKRQELESRKESRDNPTFGEYYIKWTEARRGSVRSNTIRTQASQYKDISSIVIKSTGQTFVDMKLSEIKPEDIVELQRKLKEKDRTTRTINDIMSHVKHVFKTAVKDHTIEYDPCLTVKPLRRTEECASDTTHRALSKEETAAFLKAAEGSYYYDVYRMALNTGMRIGEISALHTDDIKDGLINVERTITRLEDGSYIIGDSAKTKAGRREIPVNDNIREIIGHQMKINRLLDGIVLHDRIFKAPERGLLMSTPVNRDLKKICAAAEIKPFTIHALRATFATRLIEQGVNPRTVQDLLGHQKFETTMNLYVHVLNQTKIETMKSIIIAV